MSKVRKIFLFLLTTALIIVFTPILGLLFKAIIQTSGGHIASCMGVSIFCFDHPEYFEGFFMSYSFFVAFMLTLFGGKYRYHNLVVLMILIILIQMVYWETSILSLIAAAIGLFVSKAFLFLKKKASKNNL
jgi:hypothetical protein